MGFFHKLGNGVARFMYGRNGVDRLGIAMVWVCLGVNVLSALLSKPAPVAATVLYWISMALWGYVLFRMLSKNVYKRREENSKWLNLRWRLQGSHAGARARHADKDHKYFTCKNCKTICRVPVGKGKIEITCPKCGAKIQAKT